MADLPPGGLPGVESFFDIFTEVSYGGGGFLPMHSNALTVMRAGAGQTGTWQTEMLAMDISGGDLPPGVMIRESPTRASTGRIDATTLPGGGYHIDSFFDVFTELSLDGGTSWFPADRPMHMVGAPEPATLTLLALGGLCLVGYAVRRRR